MPREHSDRSDPDWQARYRDRLASAQEAVGAVKAGQRVFVGTGCGQPQELIKALVSRSDALADTEIVHLLTQGEAPYATQHLAQSFRVNSFFIAENVRGIIQEGLGDYTPIFLSDIPNLFKSGRLPLDIALIQVSPPDVRGRCSLGVSVDVVKSAAENAALVIAEVNAQMPRTFGDSFLSVFDLDILVPVDVPLPEVRVPEPDGVTQRIAEFLSALIENGATLELGIGRIPHAVLRFLEDKRDLGIHTEMFSDGIIDMVEAGVITGKYKSIDTGKIVASFCMGTRRLYDYIDNNPAFSFHPTEYVNDPFVISRQHKMVAINVALEVDLTGQVCADSLGTHFYSGIGGQLDFNRGAARSPGGRAIIALPSTAKQGTVSRIVSRLTPGAGVVTTRGDVHYIVTEHGTAYLHGKSVQERALALIAIAHPDYRESLLLEAIEAKYVRPELADVRGKFIVGPALKTSLTLDDGTLVRFRPIHPTDEPRMRELFYALSQQTIYYRFFQYLKRIPQKELQRFVFIDHRTEAAIVGTLPEAYGDEIIAVGRYYLNQKTNRAEVAFVVRDEWQRRGIGTFLVNYLMTIARGNGISGFTAEVLAENRGMRAVFENSNCKVQSRLREGVYSFQLDFP